MGLKFVYKHNCDCNPDFNWKSSKTFLQHLKSQRHINFMSKNPNFIMKTKKSDFDYIDENNDTIKTYIYYFG